MGQVIIYIDKKFQTTLSNVKKLKQPIFDIFGAYPKFSGHFRSSRKFYKEILDARQKILVCISEILGVFKFID